MKMHILLLGIAHLTWFLSILTVKGWDDCKPPDGYQLISPGSKFLWKNTTDKGGHNGVDGKIGILEMFEKICTAVKLEPWVPRSNADHLTHKEFYTSLDKVFGGTQFLWPFGVFYRNGVFSALDNKTLLEEGDWESNVRNDWNHFDDSTDAVKERHCVQLYPVPNAQFQYGMFTQTEYCTQVKVNKPSMQLCQWPKGSVCYIHSKEEKTLIAENAEPNRFIQIATTHAGNIYIARRKRTFSGAQQYCAANGMRLINWNELYWKDVWVPDNIFKYRKTQASTWPYFFWVETNDKLPPPPGLAGHSKPKSSDDNEPGLKMCWGFRLVVTSGAGVFASSEYFKANCRLPTNVVCIKSC